MHIIYTSLNLFLLWSNAYSSYKTLQLPKAGPRGGQSSRLSQDRKREMKTCLAIWVVWVSWRSCERLGDHTVGIVMPFYHEVKCVILIILLLTRTWGAEPIVIHVIRPTIKPYIPLIDMILHWAHEAGDFVWLLACLPYDIVHDWWYGSKSAPPYEEHHHDTRVLVKPDSLLPPEKEPEPPKPRPSPTDIKPPAYTYSVDPPTVDVLPVPSKAQMINVVQQANEVYREISNAQQQVHEQASMIGTRARKRSQANTTSNVPQVGPSAPNIVQFNPTKVTVKANMRPKSQAVQMQAPAIIKRHTGDLPLNLPLSNTQPQLRMSNLITVRGQDSQPISNTHALRNIPIAPQQPQTEDSAMPFQPAPPPSLYPTIPVFETPRLPGHLALSPLPARPPPLPVWEDVPPIPPPRPPGLLPLQLPIPMPDPQPYQFATQSQIQSQASQPPPILPKPAPPVPAPVLHQPQAQRMTHFPNTHPLPARPSAPPPVPIRRGSSTSTQGVAPPATRRGSTASQLSRRSTQDAVKEKEKLIATAATVPDTEAGFGPALPRPRGRSAAVVVSNTRKPDPFPVVLPVVVGVDRDRYGARPTAPGSAGNRRGVLGAGRGGRGLKKTAHTEREVQMTGREEVRVDMLDKPISGSDTEGADSTTSRSRSNLDTRGSLEVGEGDMEQVQVAGARVKRLRSPIRALGQIGRDRTKGFVEGKDGKAPEKPELVAGKKRRFQQTKTKGRSTFSAITSSEEEGLENENEGRAKKKQRFAPVVNVGDEEDEDEDETEDELTTPKRLFKVLSSPPSDKRSSTLLGTKHDTDVEATPQYELSMLDCELRPGVGLGPFQIGASLWTVLSNLREQKHIFPSVQVKYDPTPPSSSTAPSVPVGGATSIVLVHLYPHFDLLFSPVGQRLHAISLRRLRHGVFPSLTPASVPAPYAGPGLCLRYKDHIISSPDIVLNRNGVNKAFGPTYDRDSMKYPGVSFVFDEDPLTAVGMGTARSGEGDKNAEVKRVIVSEKFPDGHEADPFGEVVEGQIMWGDVSKAVIKVHQGVTLYFYPGVSNALQVLLGTTTAQDLQVDLGPPIRVHYKEDDRMTIHATNQLEENTTQDYFMNYFQHGLDFLIDGDAYTVKKILLHTNALGSPAFQRYKRCPWMIETTNPEEEDQGKLILQALSIGEPNTLDPGQGHVFFHDHVDRISSFLDPSGEAPPSMNVDRADDDVLSLPSSYTRLYGFDGIILEATDTGVVSAVTLY